MSLFSTTETVMSETPSPNRLHGLDAIRAFALLLGVVLHAGMSFLPGPYGIPVWIIQDNQASGLFGLTFYVPHIFRMVLFFLLAGFFARLAYEKRGALGLAFDRFKRIALPLAAFWMPVFAAIIAAVIWGAIKANGGETPEPQEQPPLSVNNFPLTHLWFLYLLCLFYPVAILARLIIRALDRNDQIGSLLDRLTGFITFSPLGIALLSIPLGLAFLNAESWMMWFGIPTPDTGLFPNLVAVTAYGMAFLFGWLLHRRMDLLGRLRKFWVLNLVIAVVLTAGCLSYIGIAPSFEAGEPTLNVRVYAFAYSAAGWAWSFCLIGVGMQLFVRESAIVRYTANASYWIYIIHLPIVMALQVAVFDLALPGVIKFMAILAVTMIVTVGSYHIIVRSTVLGGWLNGRRYGTNARVAHSPNPAKQPRKNNSDSGSLTTPQ
jgi:peptidoglycan/LPS O-acetylase OafA/YrhL